MALVNCPECGAEVSDTAEQCIHCGYSFKYRKKRNVKVIIAVIAAIIVVVGVISGCFVYQKIILPKYMFDETIKLFKGPGSHEDSKIPHVEGLEEEQTFENVKDKSNLESDDELGIKIEDMEEIPIEGEITDPLKVGDDGEEHFVIVEMSVIVNKEHKDYKKYVGSITEKSALVKDTINTELRSYTIDDLKKDSEGVQESVCECLQSLFNSRFVVKIVFKNMVFQ